MPLSKPIPIAIYIYIPPFSTVSDHLLSSYLTLRDILKTNIKMGTYCRYNFPIIVLSLALVLSLFPATASAQLRPDYYARTCPNVESIVRAAVEKKVKQTFISVPGVIRLLFHDCFVQGCDASVIIVSTPTNKAEKDHPDNLSLNGDGFDTVIQAKAALDKVLGCRNKVSCADVLVMAARDAIKLAGGPSYGVELGRLDGLVSTAASVNGKLPKPTFNLNQLNSIFAANGLTQTDMIALSAAHTVGFAHCNQFANRIGVDPTLNKTYAAKLKVECPSNVDPRVAVTIDPTTKNTFDNVYFKNLQNHMGLFSSDQVLYQDQKSKPTVDTWAHDANAFQRAFVAAITKLARVGVKTGRNGEVRRSCAAFN